MRTNNKYTCFYFIDIGRKDLVEISNTACWAGLRHPGKYWYDKDHRNILHTSPVNYIYIDQFRTKFNSLANTKRLIAIINEITPCKIVTKNKKKYIKYKLINKGSYGANLVLLNFLRMIWYTPTRFNIKQFYREIREKSNDKIDPLYFLMKIIKNNVIVTGSMYSYLNHSLVTPNITLKNSSSLLKYIGVDMDTFLLTEENL